MEVMVGAILGDGSIYYTSGSINPLFSLGQNTDAHMEYQWFTFFQFINLTNSYPSHRIDRRVYKGEQKAFTSLTFKTRSLPCLRILRKIWYNDEGVKILPCNIESQLTPVALAHWIMGDGCVQSSGGMSLATLNFSREENLLLISIQEAKFNIKATLNISNRKNGKILCVIFISSISMKTLTFLVKEHMVPSMHYKLSEARLEGRTDFKKPISVYIYDQSYNFINVIPSQVAAATFLGVSRKTIVNYQASGKLLLGQYFIYNKQLESKDMLSPIIAPDANSSKKNVFVYDEDLNLLIVAQSMTDASNFVGYERRTIPRAIESGKLLKKKYRVSFIPLK